MLDAPTLLSQIESFLSETGIQPSTLGRQAVNDGKLIERLRDGGTVTLETATRIVEWMDANRDIKGRGPRKDAEAA